MGAINHGGLPSINPDCPLDKKPVIPAQAGIQLIEKHPAKRDDMAVLYAQQGVRCWVPALRATLPLSASQRVLLLDSRLRGNDEAWDPAGVLVLCEATRSVGQSGFNNMMKNAELDEKFGYTAFRK